MSERGYMLPTEAPEAFQPSIRRLVAEFGADRVRIGYERATRFGLVHEAGVAADASWARGWSFNLREPALLDAFIADVKAQIEGTA
jgi:hypothetical protein